MENSEVLQEAILYYAEHPYDYVCDVILDSPNTGIKPSWQQKKILDAIPQAIKEGKGIASKSGHGIGKTAIESWITLWFMSVFPFPKVVGTAPAQHTLYDVFWSELAKWHSRSKVEQMFVWRKTDFRNKKHPEEWFAVARTSNKPENMQGFHAEHLLFVVDEASGVPAEILEVIEGTQTQEGSLVMMFGNPTQISGGFFDAFNSKRAFYKTFTFNSEQSPLVKKSYCEMLAAKYGKDSDIYRVRVLGLFPKAEPDTLIPLDRCETAAMKNEPIPDRASWNDVEIGIDCARFGNDESVIMYRVGNIIKTAEIDGVPCFFRKRDTMYLVGKAVQVIKQFQGKNIMVNVDDSGLGGGVTDRLKELAREGRFDATIVGVNNGERAKDDKYLNVGAEMWFFMREWILTGQIPNDNDLIGQLSTRKYSVSSSGKHVIESKEHMKDRGLTSPDRADAGVLTLRSLIYSNSGAGAKFYAC